MGDGAEGRCGDPKGSVDEEISQALHEAKRALVVGLRDYAIGHDEADVEAWSRAALAAYEDRMKHVRLMAGPAA